MTTRHPIPSHLHLAHTPLPDPGLPLAVNAHALVELGAWLLAGSGGGTLLSVTLCAAERDAAIPVTIWRGGRPDTALSTAIAAPDYRFRGVLKAAEQAADALFGALSPRWPAATPPPCLGIVTDGAGLGFCPDDPWPLAPGWMGRRARGGNGLTCLLPFSPHGSWTALTGSAG